MKPYRPALVAFLAAATAAMPCAAQQASSTPRSPAGETCTGCFAYLEFSSSLEPESHAMRGDATHASAPLPAASKPSGGFSEQAARPLASPKQ